MKKKNSNITDIFKKSSVGNFCSDIICLHCMITNAFV